MNIETSPLKIAYEQLKIDEPKLRIRDMAKKLNSSEAQLVALGDDNIPLKPLFAEIINDIPSLGKVMALTRNDDAVHERKGQYTTPTFMGSIGLIANPDIDLRLFVTHWAFAFAVAENDRKSLQFFAKDGEAVHKIYLTEQSDEQAYQTLLTKYRGFREELDVQQFETESAELPDAAIDVSSFQDDWLNMLDTHNFFGILKKHQLKRNQALRLAPDGFTYKLPLNSIDSLLELVSANDVDIMVFISNRGCIQIHTGAAKRIVTTGPWINILDPEFNMHLRQDHIAEIWHVIKPTESGKVNSVEIFNKEGELIVQFFGKRKPGIPDPTNWIDVLKAINPTQFSY